MSSLGGMRWTMSARELWLAARFSSSSSWSSAAIAAAAGPVRTTKGSSSCNLLEALLSLQLATTPPLLWDNWPTKLETLPALLKPVPSLETFRFFTVHANQSRRQNWTFWTPILHKCKVFHRGTLSTSSFSFFLFQQQNEATVFYWVFLCIIFWSNFK